MGLYMNDLALWSFDQPWSSYSYLSIYLYLDSTSTDWLQAISKARVPSRGITVKFVRSKSELIDRSSQDSLNPYRGMSKPPPLTVLSPTPNCLNSRLQSFGVLAANGGGGGGWTAAT